MCVAGAANSETRPKQVPMVIARRPLKTLGCCVLLASAIGGWLVGVAVGSGVSRQNAIGSVAARRSIPEK